VTGAEQKRISGRGEAARFGAAYERLEIGEGFHERILKHDFKIFQTIPG
jgi:hypothetical protein